MARWRCVVCGCGLRAARAKRGRHHEPPIKPALSETCSKACRKKRVQLSGYWLRRSRRRRMRSERAWRCRECGCTFKTAQANRRRRGEREIRSLLARTCSARCRSVYRRRIIRRWDRLHPERVKEYARRARVKRRRNRRAKKPPVA